MKQITEEQGLALIKEFQDKNQSGFSLNDDEIFSFKVQIRDIYVKHPLRSQVLKTQTV